MEVYGRIRYAGSGGPGPIGYSHAGRDEGSSNAVGDDARINAVGKHYEEGEVVDNSRIDAYIEVEINTGTETIWNKLSKWFKVRNVKVKQFFKRHFPNIVYYLMSDWDDMDSKKGIAHNMAVFTSFIVKFIGSLTYDLVKSIVTGIVKPVSSFVQAACNMVRLFFGGVKAVVWSFRLGRELDKIYRAMEDRSNMIVVAYVFLKWISQQRDKNLEQRILSRGIKNQHIINFKRWYNRKVEIGYSHGVHGLTGTLDVLTFGENYITKYAMEKAFIKKHPSKKITGVVCIKDDGLGVRPFGVIPIDNVSTTFIRFQDTHKMNSVLKETIDALKACETPPDEEHRSCMNKIGFAKVKENASDYPDIKSVQKQISVINDLIGFRAET